VVIAPLDTHAYRFVKLAFRKGDLAGEQKPTGLAMTRRNQGLFNGREILDVPRDADVITEEDLSNYGAALARNGFFGPTSWYMNHVTNATYALTAQNEGYLAMPVLFLAAQYDYVANVLIRGWLSPGASTAASWQKRRSAQAIGWLRKSRLK
jgi:hypothetical protein